MIKQLTYIILSCLVLASCAPTGFPETIELNKNWEFKSDTSLVWMPAIIPGNVHSDLLANDLIEDPFILNNESHLQWISTSNWEYRTSFNLNQKTLNREHLELNFKGLDTYASVYLNEKLILSANNAFRQWKVNVKPFLQSSNKMRIVFKKTSLTEEKEKAKLYYKLPEGNRVFTRKAQFQYGWDWGPIFNTSGIWKSIELDAWDDIKLESVQIQEQNITKETAQLNAKFTINSSTDKTISLVIKINNEVTLEKKVTLNSTQKEYSVPFQINAPILWWPHNMGESYLYDMTCILKRKDKIIDSTTLKKGLRTVELVTDKDSIGSSFYFKINGVPVYAKGANYIPQHSFQNKVTPAHYQKLLDDVVNSNMNMLRVWGGGIYEADLFYELCDEKGILVWQDFMFACAMYPGDTSFLNNVKHEAIDNVKRLQNHSSIVLWCGNNENSEGWHRWGWQSGKNENQKKEIWNNYLALFDTLLPNIVKKYDNDVPYWESSPKYGRGNPKYKIEGDAHDWWIWHDAFPFEHLEQNVPRFMSEFGFQSFPSYEAINYSNQNDRISIFSKAFSSHQKHARGFQLIKEYMARDFPVPTKEEDYVYVSQLLQAHGITKGIEAHRRAKPHNMGTLYWQFNDCWPAVSWSSIDFLGNWKALQYQARHSFNNILLSSIIENDTLKIYLINDELIPHSGKLSIQIMDFDATVHWSTSKSIIGKANSSTRVYLLALKSLKLKRNQVVIKTSFNKSSSLFYLVKPKELKLITSPINKEIIKTEEGFLLNLSSKTLQKNVFLYSNEKGHFNDNFFDLIPGSIKQIHFKSKSNKLGDLKVKTLNELINR